MTKSISIKLSESWTGLCNQLFSLLTGLVKAKRDPGVTTVQVGTFAPMLGVNKRVPASQIFDFPKMSQIMGLNLQDGPDIGKCSFAWYNSHNEKLFEELLGQLVFHNNFMQIVQDIVENIRSTNLHVVHFRIEDDGINHWSRMNKSTPIKFQEMLYDKYRDAINEHIPKRSQILALTFDCKHPLLQELANDYHIISLDTSDFLQEKLGYTGREACAIVDLLVGTGCTGTFIGCHNWDLKRGSTFSYVLWKMMKKAKKGIFLDLDNIKGALKIIE